MRQDHQASLARARALILRYGWNITSYQLLNPGFTLWFSRRHDALVGYVRAAGVRVVGGAPVCASSALADVAVEFEREAFAVRERVCYFAAEERLHSIYHTSPDHARIRLGAQPVWDPRGWVANMAGHPSLRAQCHRARNKGINVTHWSNDRARRHPALEACLRQWLSTRGLPSLHFLIEPDTLSTLDDRAVFVAERDGTPIGFLVASPIATRNGWLVEQFVRGHDAPNGTVELMLDTAIRWMNDMGAIYATLGLAPFSPRAGALTSSSDPQWLRMVFSSIHAFGQRWYNFDGLDFFKAKFRPMHWDPVYAIATEAVISPHTLLAVAAAFTQGRPGRTVLHGCVRSLQRAVRGLRK
jgi:phosphatidylglycerol lysyltransferase